MSWYIWQHGGGECVPASRDWSQGCGKVVTKAHHFQSFCYVLSGLSRNESCSTAKGIADSDPISFRNCGLPVLPRQLSSYRQYVQYQYVYLPELAA